MIFSRTNKETEVSLDKLAVVNDQLDAKQEIIGPVECAYCGMVYDVDDSIDMKLHDDYHAKRHDLKYKVDFVIQV